VPKLTDKQVERISSAIAEPRRFKILKDLCSHDAPMGCGQIVERHAVSLIEIERLGKFGNVILKRDVWNAYVARLAELT
jgi:hypothetical protein